MASPRSSLKVPSFTWKLAFRVLGTFFASRKVLELKTGAFFLLPLVDAFMLTMIKPYTPPSK
jgi:hypothetical protein